MTTRSNRNDDDQNAGQTQDSEKEQRQQDADQADGPSGAPTSGGGEDMSDLIETARNTEGLAVDTTSMPYARVTAGTGKADQDEIRVYTNADGQQIAQRFDAHGVYQEDVSAGDLRSKLGLDDTPAGDQPEGGRSQSPNA